LLVSPAHAIRFQSTMSTIRMDVRPGQIINRTFSLTLDKNEKPTRFRAHAEDWWRSADGNQSFYREPGTLKNSCAPWVKINPVEATIQPGQTLDIRVSIVVPAELKTGGYWCVLTLDELLDPDKITNTGTEVRCLASLSSGIFLNSGQVERTASITNVDVSKEKATVTLRNSGNCPLNVEGSLEFFVPGEAKPVAVTRFTRSWLLTDPVDTQALSAPLPEADKLPSGKYEVRAVFDIGLPHYIGVRKEMQVRREIPAISSVASPK
jgi:hypothetical protein